ncbi:MULTISPECIES: SPOR domain-containing protein [unclassified Duganella]|uniref:SPOR domain-containing protein n=1 Tax=unclassified Duganella TaxID=2636909 RepID=UPI0008821BC7|nr:MULTISPECIES: SPOR domain-containing protein [unclassified Duganella]SDF39893.1 DedD protein [Duganella sp. OV458]SDI86683.1 DedD protein [Duganella sp. OV510]
MGLFSKSGKNKQDAGQDSGYYTSADDQAMTERARSKRASSADGPKRRTRDREDDDPVLPEKKRARRRLVGAIMLALGVAVGLPMLLDSEPKPLSSDIEIKIPAKDKPLADAAPAPAPSSAATVAANAALDSREEIVEDVKPAAKPAQAPSPAAAAPVVAAVDTSKADARAEAEAKAKADAKAERELKARQDAEHKQEQERKLAEAKAEAKLKAEKQEAERKLADAKAKAAEKPAEPKPAAKNEDARALAILEGKPAAAPSAEKFVLQVAALSDQAKVDELRAKLKTGGISSFTQKTASGITRVRVGPFSSKEEAEKVKAKLSSMGLEGRLETV